MGFFDIGLGEILLILVVALIIWGPGRIPEIARTIGRVVHNLKKATFDLTTAVTKEIEGEEKAHPLQSRKNDGGGNREPSEMSNVGTQVKDK